MMPFHSKVEAANLCPTQFLRTTGVLPAANGPGNASAIGLRKIASGSEWEIWNGIQFAGRSGATHEIDILVPRAVGTQLRLTGGLPFGRPRVAIRVQGCRPTRQRGRDASLRRASLRLNGAAGEEVENLGMADALSPKNNSDKPNFVVYFSGKTRYEEIMPLLNRYTKFLPAILVKSDAANVSPLESIVAERGGFEPPIQLLTV